MDERTEKLSSHSNSTDNLEYLYQRNVDNIPNVLQSTSNTKTGHIVKNKIKSKLLTLSDFFGNLKIETVSFIFTFSYTLTRISSTSMILDKVCLAHFEYPSEICNNLANYSQLKIPIERLSTNYQLGHMLMETVPAALLSCFLAPWSDEYGRKFPVMLAMSGFLAQTLGSIICAYYINSRVEFYFIPALISGLTGGIISVLGIVYSYASDLTPVSQRTMKYALVEISSGIGQASGTAAGGWIYSWLGYPSVFFVSFVGMCISTLWVGYLIPETRGLENKDSWKVKLKSLFSCKSFRESFIATARERPQRGRKQVLLLIVSMCFIISSANAAVSINFLYVHHQFNWKNTLYSTVVSVYTLLAFILLLIVVPLFKIFHVSDPCIGLIGTISAFFKLIGIGVAWKTAVYHLANIAGLFIGCAPLAVRSRISKLVSDDDLGKVFSFVAASESLFPILGSVVISQVFNAFINTFPGAPYILLALGLIFPLSVFAWMQCLPVLNCEDIQKKEKEKSPETYTSIDV